LTTAPADAAPVYAELQVLTNFSFLEGASHPDELVIQAASLDYAAVGVADRNSLAGVVRAHTAAKQAGLRLVVGARLDLQDGPSLLAFPVDRAAYGRLSQLITLGRRRAEKGDCTLFLADLLDRGADTVLIALPPQTPDAAFDAAVGRLKASFAGHVYLAASHLYRGDDRARIAMLAGRAVRLGVPLVAAGDILMHAPERRPLADVLTCIREKVTVDSAGLLLECNAERHMKPRDELARLFRGHEDALARTVEIAERCRFSLDELAYTYPDEVVEPGETPQQSLVRLTWEGARGRYPGRIDPKVKRQIEHELELIGELDYAPYFLTVHDMVRFARSRDILCQGRGSAANSAVCYCLGITAVDPSRLDLLFERFVSAERNEPPDIDVDFEHERREEVLQYLYEKYGRHRAGMTATVVCYRARGAIREVGKALGLSEDTVAALSSQIWGWSNDGIDDDHVREIGLDPGDRRLRQALVLTHTLIGFPRHLSQHVGGMVMTRDRLDTVVPIENASMEDRTVVQWDKDDLDALGILKVDVLSLGMLTCIRKGLDLLRSHYGKSYDLATIPPEDSVVYDMLCKADSIGVFQVESRAQMAFLPRMKPRDFYDLVIEVAIVRPGPIQGDMVHPYLRRRNGEEQVEYPSEALRAVLDKTLGVPLFQEQAMKIAIVAAGFTPSEADQLRRAMATFRKMGTIHSFHRKMVQGMKERGYDEAFAERCFRQIEGFGEYGFPESHAASFALLVYVSAWMKCHYPAVFACALLNSQPMGFYAPAQIVRDAREHGVEVLPPDVNLSDWDCTLEPGGGADGHALRLGLRQVKGLSEEDGQWLVAARGNGYAQPADIWRRAGLFPRALEALAAADAFGSMGLNRRHALWDVKGLGGGGASARPLPLFEQAGEAERGTEPAVVLPAMTLGEEVVQDYSSIRLSLKDHPLHLVRGALGGVLPNAQLIEVADGGKVVIAGLVLIRQRPGSASGVIFVTLEDETGSANIVVWPAVFESHRRIVLSARLMRITGELQRQGIVTHVIAERIEDLSHLLDGLAVGQEFDLPHGRGDEVKHPNPPDPREIPRPRRRPTAVPRAHHPRDSARVLFPSRDFH